MKVESILDYELIKEIQLLSATGKLWGVYYDEFW